MARQTSAQKARKAKAAAAAAEAADVAGAAARHAAARAPHEARLAAEMAANSSGGTNSPDSDRELSAEEVAAFLAEYNAGAIEPVERTDAQRSCCHRE